MRICCWEKAYPPNTGLVYQGKKSKKYFRLGLAHSPAIESHTASKPSPDIWMKKEKVFVWQIQPGIHQNISGDRHHGLDLVLTTVGGGTWQWCFGFRSVLRSASRGRQGCFCLCCPNRALISRHRTCLQAGMKEPVSFPAIQNVHKKPLGGTWASSCL